MSVAGQRRKIGTDREGRYPHTVYIQMRIYDVQKALVGGIHTLSPVR
jgi:hypothetical protein